MSAQMCRAYAKFRCAPLRIKKALSLRDFWSRENWFQ